MGETSAALLGPCRVETSVPFSYVTNANSACLPPPSSPGDWVAPEDWVFKEECGAGVEGALFDSDWKADDAWFKVWGLGFGVEGLVFGVEVYG